MNVYFSGIGGVGIGPLAEIAHDAGYTVTGSDLAESSLTHELQSKGIAISVGPQDGLYLRTVHQKTPLQWFVYTSALPQDHPELVAARTLGIRVAKRDEFLAELITSHNLKLIAIAGTHGKTTTTGMVVWTLKQLGVPVSYSVGTTLSFGPSGAYDPNSDYFVYECDEYDRNLLHFFPYLSLITTIDYDHPDIYPTKESYNETFRRYISQSKHTIAWEKDLRDIGLVTPDNTESGGVLDDSSSSNSSSGNSNSDDNIDVVPDNATTPLRLAGEHNRRNATLVLHGLEALNLGDTEKNREILEAFPGTDRRFEKLADNLYTDYGHHPEEIAATLQLARELSDHVVLVYQPHQNWRQYALKDNYTTQFEDAEKILWLPTYLTRENPDQPTLTPQEITKNITNRRSIAYKELNDALWQDIQQYRQQGFLVLCMGAGTIDGWVRQHLHTA